MYTPTIFIVDDDPAMRDSLTWLIETTGHPVKSFTTAQEFLDEYEHGTPGCMILDVRLPGMSGLQLQQKLNSENIKLSIIIISGHGDVPMAVKAMQQGAQTFLEKPFRDQELLDSIQSALEVDEQRRKQDAVISSVMSRVKSLTPREKEVMDLMVKGKPNREIAEHYGISVKTVEVHRSRVMEKMKANSLPELVHMLLSLENNIVS